jgi:hypothetical protein
VHHEEHPSREGVLHAERLDGFLPALPFMSSYFLVSFLPFFSALFSFKLLAGFFFPSFLVSMFLLMTFPSVFPAGAESLDFPAGTKNAFSGQKNFESKIPIANCRQHPVFSHKFILLWLRLQAGLTAG